MAQKMTGAEMVIRALADQGVEHIFGYPGGAVLPIYDELFQQDKVQHVLVRQEGGAVHAAEGYARSTGKVGVVLVTSGPGATNAVTGLTDALMDSIPVVCITGQVPTHLIGNDAFQECDTVGITRPCTKHNWLVKNVDDLARVLHEAFYVARTGRPGPVVVDIPKDVQFATGTYTGPKDVKHKTYQPRVKGDPAAIAKAVDLMSRARKPRALHRRRRDQLRAEGEPAAARAGPPHRLSHHLHPDGPRRLPGLGQGVARHARHARHLRGQPRHARLRRHGVHRRALRRPHHRPHRPVLAALQEDPHRHRPLLHQQERARRRADHRRRRLRAGGADPHLADEGRHRRQDRAQDLVVADRQVAGQEVPRLQELAPTSSCRSTPSSGSTS